MQPARLRAGDVCIRRAAPLGMLVVIACGAFAGAPACRAQAGLETPQETNERIKAMSLAALREQREYVIGGGDVLSVEVFDVDELSRDVRVSQAGTIALPLLPVRLHVAGLTEIQIEQKIAEVLEANGLVTHPQVSVTVKEKRSKPITVIGAVNHPMVYQADHTVTLLELLSEAGGISNDAANTVIVTRVAADSLNDTMPPVLPKDLITPAAPSPFLAAPPSGAKPANNIPPVEETAQKAATPSPMALPASADAKDSNANVAEPPPIQITLNLDRLLESGDPKDNMALQAGDIVMVPRAGTVYAVGAVQRPGGFVLSGDHSQMTALKILALAGGVTRTAKANHAVIVRKDVNGQQTQITLNLSKIMKQQSEDVAMHPSDILFVPESGGKHAAIRFVEVALAVGTGVAIYRVAYH